jgi:L-rhamnose mutarotase
MMDRTMDGTDHELVVLHTILKEGRGHDYDDIHEVIPSEVAYALREHGVRDWRIWRDGRHVFHVVEVADYATMRAAMASHPANVAWQDRVAPLFDVPDDYGADDPVVPLLWSLAEQMEG